MRMYLKRFALFALLNILVVVTLTTILSVLGVRGGLSERGIDFQSLAIFCLVWGMGGAFISLLLSRIMAKMMMGVQVIDPRRPQSSDEQWLLETVHRLARSAGLPKMPEVGVYESPEVNAFATGPTASRALVAVSTGLFSRLNRDQVEGVLGHEVAHIANGDMVTMTLVQGVMNAFVMFFARVISFALSQNVKEENRYMVRWLTTIVLEIILGLLAAIVVAYVSRFREYRADSGGARLAGREKMIEALQGLRRSVEMIDDSNPSLSTLKISGKPGGLLALLASHPPLEERIARLEAAKL